LNRQNQPDDTPPKKLLDGGGVGGCGGLCPSLLRVRATAVTACEANVE